MCVPYVRPSPGSANKVPALTAVTIQTDRCSEYRDFCVAVGLGFIFGKNL